MKLNVFFICYLCAQTSASFFDEFRGVMASIENSLGRLLGDVVTDVRETIGCTILAVKQVLALDGGFHESSDYDRRCRGVKNGKDTPTYVQDKIEDHSIRSKSNDKPLSERVSEEIEESVRNAQNTMINLIHKNEAYGKKVKGKANIADESDRLSVISTLLRRELRNLSEEVKRELRKVKFNSNHQSVDGIWSEIKALHVIELTHRNSPEGTEIRHILNKIVSVLHGKDIENGIPLLHTKPTAENGLNDPFLEIKSQFDKMDQEHKYNTDAEDSGKSDFKEKPDEFPLTFKDVAKKILDESSRTFRLADGSSQQYEHVGPTTTDIPINTEKYVDYLEGSPDYNSFFQLAPEDSPARKEAAQEAKQLIEKSKTTDAIMKDYFKKANKVGTSVFDDPDFLDFA